MSSCRIELLEFLHFSGSAEGGLESARNFSSAFCSRRCESPAHHQFKEGAAGCVRAQTMKRYRRRLPHWDIPEAPVFVTWRLCGSLPQERSFLPEHLTSGEAFVALDRLLDSTRMGPVYLRQDKIAGIVRDHLQALVADGLCSLDRSSFVF